MNNYYIDINADVGEGVGNEAELLPYLSSCNIACGGHTGDEKSMRNTIKLAIKHQVKIGVHPSYPDLENFGRLSMQIAPTALIHSIQSQISFFKSICNQENAVLYHIKAHGALYNDIAKNRDLAKVFLEAILPFKNEIKFYVPYNSVIAEEAAKERFSIVYEAFLDRNYCSDLSLVSRHQPNAMLENPPDVLAQLLLIVKDGQLKAITGEFVKIQAETFCIHGDTEAALEILAHLYSQVSNHQISIK